MLLCLRLPKCHSLSRTEAADQLRTASTKQMAGVTGPSWILSDGFVCGCRCSGNAQLANCAVFEMMRRFLCGTLLCRLAEGTPDTAVFPAPQHRHEILPEKGPHCVAIPEPVVSDGLKQSHKAQPESTL